MSKYLLSWQEIDTLNLIIEADSKKEALDKWLSNDYDNEDIETVNIALDEESLEVEVI